MSRRCVRRLRGNVEVQYHGVSEERLTASLPTENLCRTDEDNFSHIFQRFSTFTKTFLTFSAFFNKSVYALSTRYVHILAGILGAPNCFQAASVQSLS